jgi:hypothetical protein
MRRLTALLLLIVGILMVVFGMMGAQVAGAGPLSWRVAFLLLGLGVCYAAWRLDRKPQASADAYPLRDSVGALDAPMHRSGVVMLAAITAGMLWMGALAMGSALHWPYAGWIALALSLPPACWLFAAPLQADQYIRIGPKGIDHYRMGTIQWADIDGIRMWSITVKGQTKHNLVIHLAHPTRYLDRFSWRNPFRRVLLQRRAELRFPLQWTRTNPIDIFETATRFRSAIQPPAMTGWEGDANAMVTTMRWLAAQPVARMANSEAIPSMQARFERMVALNSAMAGGWSSIDTPEMAKQRLEMIRIGDRVRSDESARMRIEIEKTLGGGVPAELDFAAMNARIRADTQSTSAGQTLQQMSSRLGDLTASRRRRQRWQSWLTIAAVVIGWIAIKFFR